MRVPDDLSHAHETVRAVAKALRIKNRDGDRRLVLGHRSWFAVTRDARMRALRILDGLTQAMVERGHGVVFEHRVEDYEPTTAFEFIVSGERVEIRLEERISRRPHVLTPAQERRAAKGDPQPGPVHDYVPCGRLVITIPDRWRSSWSDNAQRSLDSKLGMAVLGIELLGGMMRLERETEAHRRHQEEERRRLERQEKERARRERERIRNLHRMARDWRSADEIRQFVQVVEAAVSDGSRTDAFTEWLRWARGYAEALDPIRRLGSSDLTALFPGRPASL